MPFSKHETKWPELFLPLPVARSADCLRLREAAPPVLVVTTSLEALEQVANYLFNT